MEFDAAHRARKTANSGFKWAFFGQNGSDLTSYRGFERQGLSVLLAQCFIGGYLPRCSVLAEDGLPALEPLHRKVEVGSRTEVVPVFIDLCNGRGVVLRFCVALVNGGL